MLGFILGNRRLFAALALAVAVAGALGWTYRQGYVRGVSVTVEHQRVETERRQSVIDRQSDELRLQVQQILELRATRKTLVERLENEARSDNPNSRIPGPGSVRRLSERWGVNGSGATD